MKVLFFIINPAKLYMFREVAHILEGKGHSVDWLMVTKDVSEDCFKESGFKYYNIFPEGRRLPGIPPMLALIINTWKTMIRLFKYLWGKKFDLIVSGDIITFVAWIYGIKSIVPTDDNFKTVPEYSVAWLFADKVVAPDITDLGPFNYKKIGYKSNHDWAYTNPKYFKPNPEIVKQFNPENKPYAFIRLVSLTASHDTNKKGLSDEQVRELIEKLGKTMNIYIRSEKPLKEEFEKYRISVHPYYVHHAMYYADIFIGDSQTMASESGLLGTPSFRCNDFAHQIEYLNEEQEYGLVYNYLPSEYPEMLKKIDEVLSMSNAKDEWKKRVDAFGKDHIDTTQYYVNLIESYDRSKK